MSEVLAYWQGLVDEEAMLLLSGLVFVFAFQLIVFRWAERSSLVTATYLVTTVAFVGGPFVAAVNDRPDRVFNIYDREIIWTFLSFLMTIVGIACTGPRPSSRIAQSIASRT